MTSHPYSDVLMARSFSTPTLSTHAKQKLCTIDYSVKFWSTISTDICGAKKMLCRGSFAVAEMIRRSPATSRKLSSCGATMLPSTFSPLLNLSGAYGNFISKSIGAIRAPEGTLICSIINNHLPKTIDSLNHQIGQRSVRTIFEDLSELVGTGILFVKRTFQPSILRRKRKHGFLARAATRHGRDILNRRRAKGRTALCA